MIVEFGEVLESVYDKKFWFVYEVDFFEGVKVCGVGDFWEGLRLYIEKLSEVWFGIYFGLLKVCYWGYCVEKRFWNLFGKINGFSNVF